VAEPLYGIGVSVERMIELPGPFTGAGCGPRRLHPRRTVNLLAWEQGSDDVIYGGLGDDFITAGQAMTRSLRRGGAGAVLRSTWRAAVADPVCVRPGHAQARLSTTRENPLAKIEGFLLNFESFDRGLLIEDGKDSIFGDLGNDALFRAHGHDRLFGAWVTITTSSTTTSTPTARP